MRIDNRTHRRGSGLATAVLSMAAPFLAAQSTRDQAVTSAMRSEAPDLPHLAVLERVPAGNSLEVVLALARPRPFQAPTGRPFWWTLQDRLGLYLQETGGESRVFRLAVEPGPNEDCFAAIERMTEQELVLSCTGEKWAVYDNQKLVYDTRAKALVRHFSYPSFSSIRLLPSGHGTRFVAANGTDILAVESIGDGAGFRVLPEIEARTVLAGLRIQEYSTGGRLIRMPAPPESRPAGFGPGGRFRLATRRNQFGSDYQAVVESQPGGVRDFPLPQSDMDVWREARPDDARVGLRPNAAEKNEQIGPSQLEGERLWFGKTFYNSEGLTGVGGFGYFDTSARAYRMYSPPEIRRWSVSAIFVEPGAVWLALFRRGEWGNRPGGLLRWDRASERATRYDTRSIITEFTRQGRALCMAATDGILILRDGRITSHFVDRMVDGHYVVVERRAQR